MRSLVRLGICLLPLVLAGCATDPREALIRSALTKIETAAADLAAIKDRVNQAYEKRKDKKLNAAELKEASSSIDSLKKLSKELQIIKQNIEGVAGSTSEERRDELAKEYQGKLNAAMTRIQEERGELEKSLVQGETLDPEGLKELRSKLTEAEGAFVMLARQR